MKPLVIFLMLTMITEAQQVGGNGPSEQSGAATFKTSAQLVIETVDVKDKNGKPVEGLKLEDFRVTEDGVPRAIRLFEFQQLGGSESSPRDPTIMTTRPVDKTSAAQIHAGDVGTVQYKGKRLLAIYFDFTSMPVADRLRTLAATQQFIHSKATQSDLISIMTFSGGAIKVMVDFTGDRNLLERAIQGLSAREVQGSDEVSTEVSISDTGAAFGQNDSEFNIFSTDRQLSALQTAAKMLGQLSEKKSLVYFGSGLRLNGLDNQAQLHATINAAVRAGVSFWPVDARGLTVEAPLGDASKGSPGGIGMYTGALAMQRNTGFQQSQDTLWTLAEDTGGKALFDSNDLAAGIVRAQKATSSYYILGYYANADVADGKFRQVRISVKGNWNLSYRRGYYARREFTKLTLADKERQLEDAMMSGDPITDLTIALEIDYFRMNRAEYLVPLTVKIPGSELAIARRGGVERTRIDFIGEIKDEFGSTLQNVRDKVVMKLNDATAANLAHRPIEYQTAFTLLPGKYSIKFLARDLETGRIGTYQMGFAIPDLGAEMRRVPISSVVLSSQVVKWSGAGRKAPAGYDPLVRDGRRFIPSATRVFSQERDLHVMFHAYQTAAQAQDLVAYVTLFRGTSKAFESPQTRLINRATDQPDNLSIELSVTLSQLAPGEYRCQVSILDREGQKATFWQVPITLTR